MRVRGAGRGHKKNFAGGVFDVNERLMGSDMFQKREFNIKL